MSNLSKKKWRATIFQPNQPPPREQNHLQHICGMASSTLHSYTPHPIVHNENRIRFIVYLS